MSVMYIFLYLIFIMLAGKCFRSNSSGYEGMRAFDDVIEASV